MSSIHVVERGVAALSREALDGAVDDAALADRLARLHRLEQQIAAEKLRTIAELDHRKAWVGQARDTADLLTTSLHLTRPDATAAVRTATALEALPATAAGLREGGLNVDQAHEAARRLEEFDKLADQGVEFPADVAGVVDDHVARRGPGMDRRALYRELEELAHRLTRDALREKEAAAHARRNAWQRSYPDGTSKLVLGVGAIDGAKIRAVLEPLARRTGPEDSRTRRQRLADAVMEVFDRALQTDLPEVAARRPHVLLIASPEGLHGDPDADPPHLDGHGPVSAETAAQVCCDAEVAVVVKNADGAVLDARPLRRNPSRAQRAAVLGRDVSCVGCGAQAARCEIHHIRWVSRRGRTVIENLVLVCWDCHHRIHHDGWVVERDDDGTFFLRPPGRDRHTP